jgi:allantoinase
VNELIVRSRRVVLPDSIRPAAVHVRDGIIVDVSAFDAVDDAPNLDDVGGLAVMPGVVDPHVHLNEPGRAEWEGFETGTRAAAAGGVTTIVEMPLNSVPAVTTVEALELKRRAAAGKCLVDVGFWGGVVPGNADELRRLWSAGVFGFKCFLVPSGVEEFAPVSESDLRTALPILSELGAPLLVHAERPGPIDAATARIGSRNPRSYATYLATRPASAEHEAIALVISLCREYGTRAHIVHLASADALPGIDEARAAGVSMSVETCPHYLTFEAGGIADGATEFKCAPPIRDREQREGLWRGLSSGSIQIIASDHSPAPPALKERYSGNFLAAWGGIASLQVALPAAWTGAFARGHSLWQLAQWMCAAPSRLAGLDGKGSIESGADADLVVFDPDVEWVVDASRLYHRHSLTPYEGMTLRGRVERTYVRGTLASTRDAGPRPIPAGRLLTRPRRAASATSSR